MTTHVAHKTTMGGTLSSGVPYGVSGFSPALQAGDLVCVFVQFGGQAFVNNPIPGTIFWPNDSFEIIGTAAPYSTGSGVGGYTLVAIGYAEGGETEIKPTFVTSGSYSSPSMQVDVFRGLTGVTAVVAVQSSVSDPITIPTVVPSDIGEPGIVWTPFQICPDYNPSAWSPNDWTLNTIVSGGSRMAMNSGYQIESAMDASYSGTIDGYSDVGDSASICYNIALSEAPAPPDPKIVLTINDVEFTDLVEKRIRVELNDTGVVTFAIHRGHAQATAANLAKGNLVQVTIPEIHDGVLFEGFLESGDFALVASNEEGGEILSFAAPGSLSYLRRAKVHFEPLQSPASVVKLSRGTWEWINQEAGDIVQRIVSEADDRGVLPDITLTFTETEDSDGNPWTPMGSWKEDIGADLLEAVQRLVAAGQLHVEMGIGLELNLYETIGVDRSSTSFASGKVRFVKGVNVVDEISRGMNGPTYASHALVHGDDGTWLEVESPSTYPYKAEIVVEVGSHDPDVMEAAGLRALEAREAAQASIIFGHRVPWPGDGPDELSGIYLPGPAWTDNGKYWVGDLVTLHTGTGELDYDNETFRVYAITMYEDATGYLAPPIVELNAPYVDTNESDGAGGGALPAGSGGTVVGTGSTAHSHSQYQVAGDDQWKQPVRCATTASITIATGLNPGDTIDGVTLAAGDRVLVKDQADPSENGVWIVGATPTRATDLDDDDEVPGAVVVVLEGVENDGRIFRATNATPPDVGTDAIDFARVGGGDLDDLDNVDTAGKSDGDILEWDTGTSTWIAVAPPSGSVPSGTDPGDLLVWDGSGWDVLPVGADDEVLTADSGEALGTKWAAGGGSGPSDYVSGASGTGHVVIPGLGGSPDKVPGSPSAYNDEFDALSGWTTAGSLATSNVSDFPSHWHADNTSAGNEIDGIYKACPSIPFTVTVKLAAQRLDGNYGSVGILLADSTPTKFWTFEYMKHTTYPYGLQRQTWTNRTTSGTANLTSAPGPISAKYLRLYVASASSVTASWSIDGMIFQEIFSAINPGFTPANVGVSLIAYSAGVGRAEAVVDWIRFT